MIDVIKQTPDVYSQLSRDYQVIARLFTAIYNDSKSYADNMHVWSSNIDNKLSTLRARTLNFVTKHLWEYDALDAAVSCFKYVSRKKGTYTALKLCMNILMRTYKLTGESNIVISQDKLNYTLKLPTLLATLGVVQDLLNYVLPAGATYRIILYKSLDYDLIITTKTVDTIASDTIANSNLGIYSGDTTAVDNQGYRIYRNAVNGTVGNLLSAPQDVSISGSTVSFNGVTNATSYELFSDNVSIGEVSEEATV